MKKLIFTFIFLSLFVPLSCADCVETLSNFRLGDATWGGFNYEDKTKEYTTSLNSPIVSFSYKTTSNSATGIQWRVDEYIDNAWKTNVVSESKSGTSTIQLSKSARKIRFVYSGNFAGDFSNIKITQGSYLEFSTDNVNFDFIEEGSSIPSKSINVDYSALNTNLTASIGEGVFSIDKTDIAIAGCSYGSTTLNVYFRPTQLGVFADEIAFSNDFIVKVYGEYSRRINTTLKVVDEKYTSVRLSWDRVQDATAYRIVNNTNGFSYIVDGGATEYNLTGLKMGTTYNFTLYAIFNGARSINASNSVNATTKQVDIELRDCVAFEDETEKSYLVDISVERYVEYDMPNDVSYYTKRLEFEAKATKGAYIDKDGDMGVYVLLRGADNYQKISTWSGKSAGINEDYKKCVVDIPYNTIAIKFSNGIWNGSLTRYVRNVKVFKDNILEADVNSLDFGTVEYGKSIIKTFNLTYANAAKLKAGVDSDRFSIISFDNSDACTEGTQTVSVKFTPNDCMADYNSSVSIFNGQDISITLTGSLMKPSTSVNTIIWNGTASTEWDNRDNWYKEDGSTLTCADVLSEYLSVIIPAANSKKYIIPDGGITRYPVLPELSTNKAFNDDRNAKWNGAQVNAGDNAIATKVADKIFMEYGAALVGVEGLNANGVSRYNEVVVEFIARRTEWLLVGPVVKPFDVDEEGNRIVRNMLSGDFYIPNQLPHVYMHQAYIDNFGNVDWNASFMTLTKKLYENTVYAIRIPNQYGPKKHTASRYNRDNGTTFNAKDPIKYNFVGRFYNESSLPYYTDLTPMVSSLLTNTYPASIDADKLQDLGYGTFQYYDYSDCSIKDVKGENIEIMPQHGFVFTPAEGVDALTIPNTVMLNTEVGHRSASEEITSLRLSLENVSASTGSDIYIRYDELKDDKANYSVDAPKIFNSKESTLPDLYAIRYSKNWSGLSIPTLSEPIPLGVRVNADNEIFTFSLKRASGDFNIILEDRQLSKQYNLSEGEICVVDDLVAGNSEGRFYLLLSENIKEEGDDVTTDIEDNSILNGGIDIFTDDNFIVVSSDVELHSVIVSDLAGRSKTYRVSGQYVQLDLPVNIGVYTISVIGDKATRVEKIKLN